MARMTEQRRSDLLDEAVDGYLAPRPTQGGIAARAAMRRATNLVALVRNEGADTLGPYLDKLDREALYAVTVTLAAMVPDDVPTSDLLAWLEPVGRDLERAQQRRHKADRTAEYARRTEQRRADATPRPPGDPARAAEYARRTEQRRAARATSEENAA